MQNTSLAGDGWANFTFWGYQIFILMAGLGYLAGVTQSKEYAEPEWYADLWLTVVWVVYFLVFMFTSWQSVRRSIFMWPIGFIWPLF